MHRQVEFCSHVGNLSLVRDFVRQFLEQRGYSDDEINVLVLGVDEACTNIIRHAYANKADQLICLRIETLENRGVCFRLRDFADFSADPGEFESRDLEEIRPGGLGLHLMKEAFDELLYRKRKHGTELVLTKTLLKVPTNRYNTVS